MYGSITCVCESQRTTSGVIRANESTTFQIGSLVGLHPMDKARLTEQ